VSDEEALPVVIRVDEPAGDVVCPARTHFARTRVEHVHSADRDGQLSVLRGLDLQVGLSRRPGASSLVIWSFASNR
jgi:hypothetical protein